MRRVLNRLFSVIIATSVLAMAAEAAPSQRAQQSADGADVPAAGDRLFQAKLPIIGESLGALPEEVSPRFYSADRSGKKLNELMATSMPRGESMVADTRPRGRWFATDRFGAKLVMWDLYDGRVRRLILYFKDISKSRIEALKKDLAKIGREDNPDRWAQIRVNGSIISTDIDFPFDAEHGAAVITFDLSGVELYILSNHPKNDLATAMRAGKIIAGEPELAAMATFGEPTAVSQNADGSKMMQWRVGEKTAAATFRDGVVESFSASN